MEATGLAIPTELQLELDASGLTWKIPTRDYAGALVQRSETGVQELKEEVKTWLKSCHAVLLFVNTDVSDDQAQERLNELGLLITELKKLSPDGNMIGRPLALLLTKWDIQGDPCNDPVRERERALNYLQSRPSLKQIADALQNCGDRVEVFPVSAFGSHRNGNRPPVGGPRPVGLHGPLVWAVQKADEMLLERARRDAENLGGSHLWWWQRRYASAVRCFRSLKEEQGINKGPTYEMAWKEKRHWQKKLYNRWVWQGSIALFAVLALVTIGLLWHDGSGHQRAPRLAGRRSATPDSVRGECESYLVSWNPVARWSGHQHEIDGKWKDYREDREKQEYAALESYRKQNTADESAEKCDQRDKAYLLRWPSSANVPIVKGWENDDRVQAYAHQEYLKFDQEYEHFNQTIQNLGKNYDKIIAQYHGFLGRFPAVKYPKRAAQLKEIEGKLSDNQTAKNETDWGEVVDYERQNPNNFDKIISRANEYAHKPAARYRKKAQDMIARTEVRWDLAEYTKVRDATRELKDADSFEAAEYAVRRYAEE